MPETLVNTTYSFYDHNSPLIFLGGMFILSSLLALTRPRRTYVFLLIGFLILTFNFEYDKHLFLKIRTDMLDLIFPEGTRYTKYNLIRIFLESIVPIFMDVVGWGFVALGVIFAGGTKDD